MARPPRRLLSREQIVVAALELIDADGLNEFSTRKLAAALGVRGPSLYNYFAVKDEVLNAVANRITEQVDISMLGRDHWVDALRLWARSFRSVCWSTPTSSRSWLLGRIGGRRGSRWPKSCSAR